MKDNLRTLDPHDHAHLFDQMEKDIRAYVRRQRIEEVGRWLTVLGSLTVFGLLFRWMVK